MVSQGNIKASDDELRIALAMRGGVSLAVWIGGATAEIGQLCVPDDDDITTPRGFWSQLRDAAGYGNVIVDIMSGASAGGLNAVIGAASVVYGFSLDSIREVWLKLGDVDSLLRSVEGDIPATGLASLMMGDEFFLAKLAEELQGLAASGTPSATPPRVDVTLVGTLLRPITRERIRGDADTTETRFTTTFRFRSGRPIRTDFPSDPEGRRRAIERLALAGRATSSFPVAFEAASVVAPRPTSFASAAGSTAASMTQVFSEATATDSAFYVMDGGVLDNIPIGRAITAIMDAPASRPTRRVLIYVQPGSAGTAALARAQKFPRSTAAVLEALVRTRVQEETIAGDLEQLETHNARARRVRSNAAAAVGSLSLPDATNSTARYRTQRAAVEAEAVMRLLDDPIATFGRDPFPDIPASDAAADETTRRRDIDTRWRSPIKDGWDASDADGLAANLSQEIERRLAVGSLVTIGVGPLRRLAQLLIDAARAAHVCAPSQIDSASTDPNVLKARLYRALTVHTELVERPRSLAWVVLAATSQPAIGIEEWVTDAMMRIENVTKAVDPGLVTTYLDASETRLPGMTGSDTTGAGDLSAADAEMRTHLDRLLKGEPDGPPGEDIRDALWERLCSIAKALRDIPVDKGQLDKRCDNAEVGPRVLRWLQSSNTDAAQALEVLELATFDASTGGEVGATAVDFFRLSGANATPLAAAFPRLLESDRERDPMSTIVARLSGDQKKLTPQVKLAGNELMNFSAFLRRRWRANDWMWGRLDAVPTMVEIVLEPSRLAGLARRVESSEGRPAVVPALLERFEAIVCRSGKNTNSAEWQQFLFDSAWAPRRDAIKTMLEKVAAAEGTPIVAADVAPLRDALVASRQWDIIAELLPTVHDDDERDEPIDVSSLVTMANEYGVGVETISNPADPNDPQVIRKTVMAARAVLAQTSSSKAVRTAFRVAGSLVGALSWIWLKKTAPVVCRLGLLLGGLAALTVPAYFITDGDWATRLAAAAAGPAAMIILAGAALFLVRSRAAGLMLVLAGAGLGFWACSGGTLYALAVVLAPIGATALVAGIVLHVIMRARPSL